MSKVEKSFEDLILEDKIDAARTLANLSLRMHRRRILNQIEPALVKRHAEEVKDGNVRGINLDPFGLLRPELPTADSEGS